MILQYDRNPLFNLKQPKSNSFYGWHFSKLYTKKLTLSQNIFYTFERKKIMQFIFIFLSRTLGIW